MSLAGKVALVTGGAAGLGRAMAALFAQRGARLVLLDLNINSLQDTCRQLTADAGPDRVHVIQCDVTRGDDFTAAVAEGARRWGRLDVFVNNAGISNEQRWEKTVDVNLSAVIRGTLLAVDHMGTHRGGRGGLVINVASLAGLNPNPFFPVYAATKFAVVGFTRSMGGDTQLAYHGVRVNTICPSFADTDILRSVGSVMYPDAQQVDPKVLFDSVGGVMTPEYVAQGAAMFVDDTKHNGAVMRITPKRGHEILTAKHLNHIRGKFHSKI